jgi:DNA-binding response OmpR family regulator
LKRYTVLILVRNRPLEKQLLAGLGQHYDVMVARLRREALSCLEDKAVDLILIDVPSIRFSLARFYDDVLTDGPERRLFLLLNKGTRLDQLPRVHGHLRHTFTISQLLRRLARVLPATQGKIVEWCGLRLDIDGHFLMWDTQQASLTPKQAALICAFLQLPETVISRAQLMQDVWGTDFLGDTRTLDVHIHWLRKVLKRLQAPFAFETIRGKGYRLGATSAVPCDGGDVA